MDHKTFFALCSPETEELYQAIKARLVEELRSKTYYKGSFIELPLIDTTEEGKGNGN